MWIALAETVAGVGNLVLLALLLGGLVVSVRRVLGLRVGWVRTVFVMFVGWAVLLPTSVRFAVAFDIASVDGRLRTSNGVALAFFAVVTLWIFLACLIALLVLEVLIPTGRVPGPRSALLGFVAWLKRTKRFTIMSWIGITTGVNVVLRGGPGSTDFGSTMTVFLNRAGVTFIKLGQVLATRDDLFSRDTTAALSTLQAQAEPAPAEDIVSVFTADIGRAPDEAFAVFVYEPLAAGSIAQVHAAVLRDGREVVVKVQRPGARAQVAVDTDILSRVAGTLESRWGWASDIALTDIVSQFADSLHDELDHRREATQTIAAAAAFSSFDDIVVPTVFPELSGSRTLVLERLHGRPLAGGLAEDTFVSDEQRAALARTLINATLEAILIKGVFHADLHPGNILILDDGRLGIIDFGSVGLLGSDLRQLLGALLIGVFVDDAATVTSSVMLAFDTPDDIDVERLRRDLGRELAALRGRESLDTESVARVFGVLRDHRVRVPGDVLAAMRTLASVDAAVHILDPTTGFLRVAQEALPSILARAADLKTIAARTVAGAIVSASIVQRLPERIEVLTRNLQGGSTLSAARPISHPDDRRWLRMRVTDVLTAGFGMVACVLAVVLILAPSGPLLTPRLSLAALTGLGLGFCGVILALRVVIRAFPLGPDTDH